MLVYPSEAEPVFLQYCFHFVHHFQVDAELGVFAACDHFCMMARSYARIEADCDLSSRIEPSVLSQLGQRVTAYQDAFVDGILHFFGRNIVGHEQYLIRPVSCSQQDMYLSGRHGVRVEPFIPDYFQQFQVRIGLYRVVGSVVGIRDESGQLTAPLPEYRLIVDIQRTAVFPDQFGRFAAAIEICLFGKVYLHAVSPIYFSIYYVDTCFCYIVLYVSFISFLIIVKGVLALSRLSEWPSVPEEVNDAYDQQCQQQYRTECIEQHARNGFFLFPCHRTDTWPPLFDCQPILPCDIH